MIDRFGLCPNPDCNINWDSGDILLQIKRIETLHNRTDPEIMQLASEFGYSTMEKKHFSKVIAIQVHKSQSQPDDVNLYQCPECRHVWNADTGEHYHDILTAKTELQNVKSA